MNDPTGDLFARSERINRRLSVAGWGFIVVGLVLFVAWLQS